jgi:putative ABC transport system permease protein
VLTGGNLPANQLVVWLQGNPSSPTGPNTGAVPGRNNGGDSSGPGPAAITNARRTSAAIAQQLSARHLLQVDVAVDPTSQVPAGSPPGANQAVLVHPLNEHGQHGWTFITTPLVATPAVLHFYRIRAGDISPSADILTARTDLSDAQLGSGFKGQFSPTDVEVIKGLPNYTSAPNTLITPQAMTAHGLTAQPAGWLLQAPRPLTAAQISTARHLAAASGISIETRTSADPSLQRLRAYSTITGLLVALGVLAMTVGLIRSETANDLRTLAATGASSGTRRTLTATTAAALAVLAGILGIAGAYLALIAWHWRDVSYLDPPPYLELAALLLGLPFAALIGGWFFGRTRNDIARRPLD